MNWLQISTWLIPAILGVALKLSAVKPLDKEIIIRAIIQGVAIGYFAKEYCILKGWTDYIQFVSGLAAVSAEFIVQYAIKGKWLSKNKTEIDLKDEN